MYFAEIADMCPVYCILTGFFVHATVTVYIDQFDVCFCVQTLLTFKVVYCMIYIFCDLCFFKMCVFQMCHLLKPIKIFLTLKVVYVFLEFKLFSLFTMLYWSLETQKQICL